MGAGWIELVETQNRSNKVQLARICKLLDWLERQAGRADWANNKNKPIECDMAGR